MKDIIKFLDTHYSSALKLVSDFDITKKKKWNPQIYLNELYVQLGHVYSVLIPDENTEEKNRKIDNLGDELSDVLLQLINLAKIMNINMYDIKEYDSYKYDNIDGLSVLLGQLTEAIMETYQCRFKKSRDGFDSSYDFIKDRLFKLFIISFNISKKYKLDMIKEFELMKKDAHNFLNRFKERNDIIEEYIDIYDEKENLLGYCEKKKAHQLGYWHKVFGCIVFNSKRKKVFMQLKNPNHNKIHDKPLLEITAGGHLIAGETLENGIREIKEETGLDVEYNLLNFIERRKCNKIINKNYKIKEFQYYYSLDMNMKVTDFKNYDKEEVLGFVELNINDLINLIRDDKIKSIKGKRENGLKVEILLSDLDEAYIKDGLYITLLEHLNVNKEKRNTNKKLREMYKKVNSNRKVNPTLYLFDDGKVCEHKDFNKEGIKYSVMKVNTNVNTNNFLVYLLVIANNRSIPQLLKKDFKSKKGTEKYFNDLCELVEKNPNREIILKCYNQFVGEQNSIL